MSRRTSIPAEWFAAEYARDTDPWRFATSDYERTKYADTVGALGERCFASGFEVGCSIGVLTAALAARCERLFAVDVAEAALVQARGRCPGVAFARMRVPDAWPARGFDLIVLSEVLYYLEPAEIDRVAAHVRATLLPRGVVLLVHWTGETDYPISGDAAAERFLAAAAPALRPVRQFRRPKYRLDRLDRS